MGKTLSIVLLVGLAVTSLLSVLSFDFADAQSGLITFLNVDTTWTDSKTLSGPVVVSTGVTLTINSGVTINLNGYYLYVNGTLRSVGSASQNIFLYGGSLTFNDSATANSLLENTILNTTVTSTKPLTVNNNTLNAAFTTGSGSTLTNNKINAALTLANSCTLSNNYITGPVSAGNGTTITGNEVYNETIAGNNTMVSNNVMNYNKAISGGWGGYGYSTALKVESGSVVSNNTITGDVDVFNSTVTGNVICGGGPFTDWVGRPEDATSALEAHGFCTVTGNVLWSRTGGYGLLTQRLYSYNYTSGQGGYTGYVTVHNNIIKNTLRIAGDALVENNRIDGGVQVGDVYISAFNEIDYGYGNSTIRGNIITGYGIFSSYSGGSTSIQNNLIANVSNGISLRSNLTIIQNNTIQNTNTAITLTTGTPTINYNNFLNYTTASITLSGNPANIDATYNYWGQTNLDAINLTIHDLKYDLTVGRVSFTPILDTVNPNAPSLAYSLQLPVDVSTQPTPTPTLPTPTPTQTVVPTATSTATASASNGNSDSSPNHTSSSSTPSPAIPEFTTLAVGLVGLVGAGLAVLYVVAKKRVR